MNLREIREEIHAALDYNPDAKVYDDSLTRVINRHYLQVSSQYQWLFMQRKLDLLLRADIVGTTVSTVTADGSRKLTLQLGTPVLVLPKDIEGQTFVLNNEEHEITRRIDARTFVIDNVINAGVYSTWKIQYQKFPMPKDCVEVLGVMDRGLKNTEDIGYNDDDDVGQIFTKTTTAPNRGRFTFLDAKKEEYLYLDRESTGDPFVSVEEMHFNISPPDYAPHLRQKGGTEGLFVSGATYEYCYTYVYAGKESPPSPTASFTVVDGTDAVNVEKMIDTGALGLSVKDTGRLKKIYRRQSAGSTSELGHVKIGAGVWRHIATRDETTTSFGDLARENSSSYKTVLDTDSVTPSGTIYDAPQLNESGPRQYLRFWYTPADDYKVEIRFHRRPYRLVNDADAPNWPVQYHHYLVYASLRDVSLQHGLSSYSQLYAARAVDLLEKMKSKYLSRSDRVFIRRGFDRAMADRERWGIPSKS